MGGSKNRIKLSMGVSIHGEPEPDDGWMYSLLLLRIHRACPCPSTAIIGRVIRSVLPHGEAWCECTLFVTRFGDPAPPTWTYAVAYSKTTVRFGGSTTVALAANVDVA